jgi:glucose-1-phosphate adenylyltransferase
MLDAIRRLSTFVMAGGRGERLYPLTRDRAKPAVPFGGVYRIIDFTLSNCINSGIRRIHVLTQYKSHSLSSHIKKGWNLFHSEVGEYIDVVPAQQRVGEHWYRGTADAVFQNFYILERENPQYVLILAGDHVYKMDYSKMLEFHIRREAEVTVGVVEMPREQGVHLGVVQVGEDRRITRFEEKPERPSPIPGMPERIYASMGIYIFSSQVLYEELRPNSMGEGRYDFGRDILPRAVRARRIFAYPFVDENLADPPYWRDIGTLDAYYEANMDLVAVTPRFNLYDRRWPVRTCQPQLPPVKMVFADEGKNARRGEALDSLLSAGCIVSGGTVVRSVLSPQVRVNSFSLVEDSVLMSGVEVGRYARVRKAIVDKFVKIPPGVHIGWDLEEDRRRFTVTPEGVVVVPKGTIIEPERQPLRWLALRMDKAETEERAPSPASGVAPAVD